jgi:hypothetical protein
MGLFEEALVETLPIAWPGAGSLPGIMIAIVDGDGVRL